MQKESPRPHSRPLVKIRLLLGAAEGIGTAVKNGGGDKVGAKDGLGHDSHPGEKIAEEKPF